MNINTNKTRIYSQRKNESSSSYTISTHNTR